MRASIRPKVGDRQRREIERLVQERIMEETSGIVRRYMKITCIALNQQFGFGAVRLSRLLEQIEQVSSEADRDEELWTHIEARLAQMGIQANEEITE